MNNIQEILDAPAPRSIWQAPWPIRADYRPSPVDWRREVFYFLLPDRFSDERADRALLDRAYPAARNRPPGWRWDEWAASGKNRFQGGTLRGVTSRLDYLRDLGITALWIGPVWKQRATTAAPEEPDTPDDYHGYSIQNFLDVDPRFGTRADLVELVDEAHQRDIKVILDVIFNHTAETWDYLGDPGGPEYAIRPPFRRDPRYAFGAWRDGRGGRLARDAAPTGIEEGVWPVELQDPGAYSRAGGDGKGFGEGAWDDPLAQPRLTDWFNRDLDQSRALQTMIRIWSYWVALLGVDGYRVDTLKHVSLDDARLFCGALREFADGLGMANFLIVGEVGGGDEIEQYYLDTIGRNLTAVLETGQTRAELRQVALDRQDLASDFFGRFRLASGTHRFLGSAYMASSEDHDCNWISPQVRFWAGDSHGPEPDPEKGLIAAALVLFVLGIPCLYYGSEQGLTGPEMRERKWLPEWGVSNASGDRFLREAMFGPEHPRRAGAAGMPAPGQPLDDHALFDPGVPGFGPFGSTGQHVFDPDFPLFRRIRMLLRTRADHPALSVGRQYLREIAAPGGGFAYPQRDDVIAWSRILAGHEALCVVNPGLTESRVVRARVDAVLNERTPVFTVVANTADIDGVTKHPVGSHVDVRSDPDSTRYVELLDVPRASVLVLTNDPRQGAR
ncbi:hypothetical protein J5X84_20280 [Streptosporangiaceae bacterium NEAU-GS5]|nr:hypothetical protein [Streptosporangiaceae bacterium NEAU-GS5]